MTAFNEDKGIRRVNPYIFSGLIDIAKNIMSKNKCTNFKEKIDFNSMDIIRMIDNYKNLLG
ncbi:MAG: hypothetical protein CNLJKLNK_00851 [Holosporales bacterium]